MRYAVTFLETPFKELQRHLFEIDRSVEQAAFAICRTSVGPSETRLLVTRVIPVLAADILEQTPVNIRIAPIAFIRAMKAANEIKGSFVLIHSHPGGFLQHSEQDNREEAKLFPTAFERVHNSIVHASLIMTEPSQICGRVWLPNEAPVAIDVIRVVGSRLQLFFAGNDPDIHPDIFDRQIRAFGPHIQGLLSRLRIGVVGNGGTGSAVAEQLIRLGVGDLLCIDHDTFDRSNINRVYGSIIDDHGLPKPRIVARSARFIGVNTSVRALETSVTYRSAVEQLKECDLVFGCTDDEWGRSILSRMAVYYAIPVFDMGVKIDSADGVISSVEGRVTTLMPGAACLYCRGRITARNVQGESLQATDPENAEIQRAAGYLQNLEERAPAVIPFTTEVASTAVSEMLHRLTGFMGADRESTEVLLLIDRTTKRTNRIMPRSDCWCGDISKWNRGDARLPLDITWRRE